MRHNSVTHIRYFNYAFVLPKPFIESCSYRGVAEIRPVAWNWTGHRLSPMPSEIGLAVGAGVMNVHTLVDAARNQTATKPAAEECDQKTGNVCNQTGRGCGLGIDFGMAARADHVRGCRSDRDDRGDDGRSILLWRVRYEWAGRWNASHRLCVAGRSRWWGHRKTVGWWWSLLLAHYSMCFFSTLASNESNSSNGEIGPTRMYTLHYDGKFSITNFLHVQTLQTGIPTIRCAKKFATLKHHAQQLKVLRIFFHNLNLAFF